MQKLTALQVAQLNFTRIRGIATKNPVVRAVRELAVGESIAVPNDEWHGYYKGGPSNCQMKLDRFKDKKEYTCRTLANKEGYVITRIR